MRKKGKNDMQPMNFSTLVKPVVERSRMIVGSLLSLIVIVFLLLLAMLRPTAAPAPDHAANFGEQPANINAPVATMSYDSNAHVQKQNLCGFFPLPFLCPGSAAASSSAASGGLFGGAAASSSAAAGGGLFGGAAASSSAAAGGGLFGGAAASSSAAAGGGLFGGAAASSSAAASGGLLGGAAASSSAAAGGI